MNNVFILAALGFMLIYNLYFIKNIDYNYIKRLSYIVPFVLGAILFNLFFGGFIYDELLGQKNYTFLLLPFWGIWLTLYAYGFRTLLILRKSDNVNNVNPGSIDVINKWLIYLYVCDFASIILFGLIYF